MKRQGQDSPQKQISKDPDLNEVWHQLTSVFSKTSYSSQNQIRISQCHNFIGAHLNCCLILKRKNKVIFLKIVGLSRLQCNSGYSNALQICKISTRTLSKDPVVCWSQENKNFEVKKVIASSNLYDMTGNIEEYLRITIKQMQTILIRCTDQLKNIQRNQGKGQKKWKSQQLQKKISNLQKIKYQIQVERKKRKNTTKLVDYYSSRIKSYLQFHNLREKCLTNSQNLIQKLRQGFVKSQINQGQAVIIYKQIINQLNKEENGESKNKIQQKITRILSGIEFEQIVQIQGQDIQGTFSHITLIQTIYRIIFSLNPKTNKYFKQIIRQSNNSSQLASNKQMNSSSQEPKEQKKCRGIFIKKSKCEGCLNQSQQRINQNKIVFQIQLKILLNMKNSYNKYICNYFIEQSNFESMNVRSLYSLRYPYTSLMKFGSTKEVGNLIKHLGKLFKFLSQLAQGLYFLHKNLIIHRDLKPSNICIDQKGHPKIIDFGSSCPFYKQQESQDKLYFNQTLRSTEGYYYKYNQLPSELLGKYLRNIYERHQSFDVYSLGKITQQFLPNLKHVNQKYFSIILENIQYFLKKSKDIHPDDRLTVVEAAIFLRQLTSLIYQLIDFNNN